ncbi:NLI interacting factor-like phosphatase family protein [Tritrichomonas foetus]|uniref:NLI interacting factor-like phosphatase family protein n=1 Tax=Tritrichomonas foetus TaxID=1144522 RepID=A0A1J4KBS9_9EUKA|nr:NLI interacting factor-like phosphatase family protein [Tritrichomonas foetus]|eukprot:OHT08368.1 NLI interacting factor-like phosphatase family protein [Tritrichomonas foetus]
MRQNTVFFHFFFVSNSFSMSTLIAHTPAAVQSSMMTETATVAACIAPVFKKCSLILDLDETLIHSSFIEPEHYDFKLTVEYDNRSVDIFVQKRPGLFEFIRAVAMEFDVFIFTASMPAYAVPVIKALIPTFHESRILTRMHCRCVNGVIVKDISIFQRDLARMIIVDNSAESFMMQQENGILISTWTGDPSDAALNEELLPFLRQCAMADDVRNVITRSYAS